MKVPFLNGFVVLLNAHTLMAHGGKTARYPLELLLLALPEIIREKPRLRGNAAIINRHKYARAPFTRCLTKAFERYEIDSSSSTTCYIVAFMPYE